MGRVVARAQVNQRYAAGVTAAGSIANFLVTGVKNGDAYQRAGAFVGGGDEHNAFHVAIDNTAGSRRWGSR